MDKNDYKRKLMSMGYRIEGDTTFLETPYGTWVEEITQNQNGFGLVTIKNPLEENTRNAIKSTTENVDL